MGRRAEVEAGRCAGAGLPPGAGQRARARSFAEEGDGGGEEDGVAEVEAGRAPGRARRAGASLPRAPAGRWAAARGRARHARGSSPHALEGRWADARGRALRHYGR